MTFSNFTLISSLECTDDKENKIVNNIAMNFININLVKSLLIPLLFTISFNTSAKDELEVGNMAPDFSLVDQNSKTHTLSEYKGNWVVIYFYPKDDTPGCTIETNDFNKLHSKFKKLDCEIYGISKDSIKSHDKFRDKYKIKFDLLADEDLKVLKKYKVWGKKKFMGREFMGIIRTTYLIDKKGKILKVWDNVKVKDHAKEVLETLQNIVKK